MTTRNTLTNAALITSAYAMCWLAPHFVVALVVSCVIGAAALTAVALAMAVLQPEPTSKDR